MSNKGKRYGVCENFDACNKAKTGEKIELDELDDFICPECHSDLREIQVAKKLNRKWIGGAVMLVIGIALAIYFVCFRTPYVSKLSDNTPPADTLITDEGGKLQNPTGGEGEPQDSIDRKGELQESTGEGGVTEPHPEPLRIIDLGYATYEGPHKNGKPHGPGGKLTFKKNYTLDLKKMPAEYVEVKDGDYMIDVKFNNGRLVQGTIYFTNGTHKWISIGL